MLRRLGLCELGQRRLPLRTSPVATAHIARAGSGHALCGGHVKTGGGYG